MAYKIYSIEIVNFKFFEKPFTLPVDGKHVLLFGENGSGKSSLFWSFYTHYQAAYKEEADARKYFLSTQKESLRNKFSPSTAPSGIKVTFKDENGTMLMVEDSDTTQSVSSKATRNMMLETMASSDFLNYKFLSAIFDFKNSQENELFKVFEKEIFQYLSLRTSLVLGGSNKGNDALTWWNYIRSEYLNLPRNRKNYNDFNQNAPEYKAFLAQLKSFNDDTRYALTQLIISANQLLRNDFNIPVELTVRYEGARFNERIHISSRSRDRKVSPPRVILNAKMVHTDIASPEVQHPSSFFNEAKLTCMALALRLAVLNGKPTAGASYASTLFVDDMLISLDMAYRRKVIEVLLNSTTNRQMLFFTHDRSLFHIIKEELNTRKQAKDWLFYELYADDDNGHPSPCLIKPLTALDEAKSFLHGYRIPACANALRRACEKELKRLLPYNLQLKKDPQELSAPQLLDLNGLICNFEKIRIELGLPDLVHGLSTDRKLILNPFSHDDINTPFYHEELKRLIDCCEKLSKVERLDIVTKDMIRKEICRITVNNGPYQAETTFEFVETMIQYKYAGTVFTTQPRVKVLTYTVDARFVGKEKGLSILYSDLYNSLSYNATTCPKLKDVLYKSNGTLLIQ